MLDKKKSTKLSVMHVANLIREKVLLGQFVPGQHLSEISLCQEFDVSRNTLREVFRTLTQEGLLDYHPNKGVFVATPDIAMIHDVYKVRRFIECTAVVEAKAHHPALKTMKMAIENARYCKQNLDWKGVGSADIHFHTALVSLADSRRLSFYFARLAVELRLVFGLIAEPEYLHAPFIDSNAYIVSCLEEGNHQELAGYLDAYLRRAEDFIITAYQRVIADAT